MSLSLPVLAEQAGESASFTTAPPRSSSFGSVERGLASRALPSREKRIWLAAGEWLLIVCFVITVWLAHWDGPAEPCTYT